MFIVVAFCSFKQNAMFFQLLHLSSRNQRQLNLQTRKDFASHDAFCQLGCRVASCAPKIWHEHVSKLQAAVEVKGRCLDLIKEVVSMLTILFWCCFF